MNLDYFYSRSDGENEEGKDTQLSGEMNASAITWENKAKKRNPDSFRSILIEFTSI